MPDFAGTSSAVARRFHRSQEGYVRTRDGDVTIFRITAISERAVDIFLHLSARLDAVVDVVIDHPRDGTAWEGRMRFLPDVRESLGRLRWPLATHGGVEVSLVTPEDQVTLTTALEVVIFTRSDRWPTLLDAEGIEPQETAPRVVWRPDLVPWSPAPELSEALASVAERLNLEVT